MMIPINQVGHPVWKVEMIRKKNLEAAGRVKNEKKAAERLVREAKEKAQAELQKIKEQGTRK